MLGRSAKLEVPRRAVALHLLSSLAAVAWMGASLFFACGGLLNSLTDQRLLADLQSATRALTLEYLRSHSADLESGRLLQKTVERLQREQRLYYCAVVSADGYLLAHSQREQVGQLYQPPDGTPLEREHRQGVRFVGPGHRYLRQYHAPLQAQGKPVGNVYLAAEELDPWSLTRELTGNALLILSVPLALIALGSWTIHRISRCTSGVETQLRNAALATTLDDAELRPLRDASALALGWNRIVGRLEKQQSGNLQQRLNDAVEVLRQDKSVEVLNCLTEGVAVTDGEGRITFVNQAFTSMFASELPGESLEGKAISQLLPLPADGDCGLLRAEFFGRHVIEELHRTHGALEQALRVSRTPLRSADRTGAHGHVWSIRDVTQQKMAEQMRSQFLDSATHELRTPLANIKAYAETLALGDMLDVENQKEFCNTINTEATRLARFIDDLLSISSMEVGSLSLDRQGVDLERLFQEVINKIRPQLDQKEITFEVTFPEKYPRLKLDKDKIMVAFVNLLGNAAKYTPDQGRVGLVVKVNETEVVIDVEDTGVGISDKELPQVFDKFFRSANPAVQQETGTGLGLSMAREIVCLHGGDLTVQSELGKGSTFRATLPLK